MNRQLIILIGISLVVVIIAAFLAFVFAPSNQNGNQSSGDRNGFASLFPFNFGSTPDPDGGGNIIDGSGDSVDSHPVPVLREISPEPTSGGYLYPNEGTGETMIRYIDRATGHVFETSSETLASTRITITTIPEIQEVLFGDENNFIIRSLNEGVALENVYVNLIAAQEEQSVRGSFLRSWNRVAVDPSGETILVVDETSSGSNVYLSDLDGGNERLVLTSPISSWVPLQSNIGAYLYTAPTPGVDGFLYVIRNGELMRIIGNIEGMVAQVSPSGRYVLISTSENGSELQLYDTQDNAFYDSIFNTVANKCVFVSETPVQIVCGVPTVLVQGDYPNDWLLGGTHFSDDVWMVEPVSGTASQIISPARIAGRALDVWQPTVSSDGAYLGFINKNDLSYWTLQLKEPEVGEEN